MDSGGLPNTVARGTSHDRPTNYGNSPRNNVFAVTFQATITLPEQSLAPYREHSCSIHLAWLSLPRLLSGRA